MANDPTNIYSRALAEAMSELGGLRAEFDRISKRKAQLEAFIANAEPLVPESLPTLQFPEPHPVEKQVSPRPTAQPIWKSILLAINGKADAFSVRDALDALERIGRGVDSPNKFQIVRAVLTKKTDNFVRLSTPGLYAVKSDAKEQEVASEEGTS